MVEVIFKMKKIVALSVALFFLINSVTAQNSISGYIVSLETAKPIENATILLHDRYNLPLKDTVRVTSDSTGFYEIGSVESGSYIVNSWTTYRAMNQRYAMVLQSNIIKVDRDINIDIVFSENAFKMHLNIQHNGFGSLSERSSNLVAFQAVRPHFYVDSKREPVGSYFIENFDKVKW